MRILHDSTTQLLSNQRNEADRGGAKPVDVAASLGYANANMTQNLYAHDTEDMMQETARLFGEIIGK